jgi:hypothetical protein
VAASRHGLTARLAWSSSHSAQPARARRGARAPAMVTTWWRAVVAGSVQPGDEVWGNQWG